MKGVVYKVSAMGKIARSLSISNPSRSSLRRLVMLQMNLGPGDSVRELSQRKGLLRKTASNLSGHYTDSVFMGLE